MALGILEPAVEHVPGTVYVYEADQRQAELLEAAHNLKRDKEGRRILVPQPSNDPNDPLVSFQEAFSKPEADQSRIGRSGRGTSSSGFYVLCPVSRRRHLLFSPLIQSLLR